jgi:hypothetical protein
MVGTIISMTIVLAFAALLAWAGAYQSAAYWVIGGIIGNVIAYMGWQRWKQRTANGRFDR